jgi:Domain of unknown function (DUF4279)
MTIIRTSIGLALYFYGDKLNPVGLTKILGVNPTYGHMKGHVYYTKTNERVQRKSGLWALVSKSDSEDMSAHIDELVSAFEMIANKNLKLLSLEGVESAHIDIFICATTQDGLGEIKFELNADRQRSLTSLGLPIKFTVDKIHE